MAKKFTITIPEARIDALQERLRTTQFPEAPAHASWSYGADLDYMKDLVAYWEKSFNWKQAEKQLNQFDHFTADINGVNMHFIHQKSNNPMLPRCC